MNTENSEIENQLKSIKKWVVAGAIGFLLIGLGVVVFSVSTFQMISNFGNEYGEVTCGDDASSFSRAGVSRLIEQGKIGEALNLTISRLETHPNDPTAHWLKARIHMIEEDWQAALKHVDKAELLAPSWEEEFLAPMRKKIERATN